MLKKNKVPFVLIDRYFSNFNANSVRINNYEAAYNATEHLIHTGRKHIALVTYKDTGMSHFAERTSGYKAALKKHKLPLSLISVPYQQMEKEVPLVIAQLINNESADAVFFATHSLAIEGLKQINRMNVDVPRQLAVLSFDENDAFDLFDPPVSFIRQPLTSIAGEAVRLLVEHIHHPTARQTVIELDTELVVRESCRAARHKKAV